MIYCADFLEKNEKKTQNEDDIKLQEWNEHIVHQVEISECLRDYAFEMWWISIV